jgi:hypothetical protein
MCRIYHRLAMHSTQHSIGRLVTDQLTPQPCSLHCHPATSVVCFHSISERLREDFEPRYLSATVMSPVSFRSLLHVELTKPLPSRRTTLLIENYVLYALLCAQPASCTAADKTERLLTDAEAAPSPRHPQPPLCCRATMRTSH